MSLDCGAPPWLSVTVNPEDEPTLVMSAVTLNVGSGQLLTLVNVITPGVHKGIPQVIDLTLKVVSSPHTSSRCV